MKTRCPRLAWFAPAMFALSVHAAQTNPKPVETPSPGYPAALTNTGTSGVAMIDILVRTDGSVGDARLKSADHEAFGDAALGAIRRWRFEPATVDGAPVEKRVTVPFKFVAPVTQQLNATFKRTLFQDVPEQVLTPKEYGRKLKPTKPIRPLYPAAAKGKQATVQVKFLVAPDGKTINPEILGNPPKEFVLPAIATVAGASFEPPVKDGKGVYVEMMTKLAFQPPQRGKKGGGGRAGGSGGDGGGGFGGGFGGGGGGDPDE
jgi:TonB family protein